MPANPKLTPEQWAKVRNERETNNASYRALGQMFGISGVAIGKRAKREGWAKQQPSAQNIDGKGQADQNVSDIGVLMRRIAELETVLATERKAFENGYALGSRHALIKVEVGMSAFDLPISRRSANLPRRGETRIRIVIV